MKIVLDIKDSKAEFIMELLSSFSYVKTEPIDTLNKPKKKAIKNVYQQAFAKDMEQTIKEIEADFYEKNNKNKKLRKSA
jgi:hypothetical protein